MQCSCLLISADLVFYHRNVGFTIDVKIATSADLGFAESTTLETGNILVLLTVRDHPFFCPQTWHLSLFHILWVLTSMALSALPRLKSTHEQLNQAGCNGNPLLDPEIWEMQQQDWEPRAPWKGSLIH